jgi:branched-chain amino acid transport system ATP-binding protein
MPDVLTIDKLSAGYGEALVLSGISLRLGQGEAIALLGRNGVGKTTLLNSIIGVTRHFGGTVMLSGQDVTRYRPEQRAVAGVGWVPQERNIFRSLTVEENLTAVALPGPWDVARVYDMFPRLRERRSILGTQLSGGEQQMLAIGRALMSRPRLLLLDEPSLGLAPLIARQIFDAIRTLNRQDGLTVLIVEQNANHALKLAHRGYVMVNGLITLSGTGSELLQRPEIRAAYLEGGRRG